MKKNPPTTARAIGAADRGLGDAASQAALNLRSRIRGNLVGAIGDSITAAFGTTTGVRSPDNYFPRMCYSSVGRMRWGGIWAVGGYTLAQIQELMLPSALAASPAIHACVVFGGTNDMPSATLTAARVTHLEICEELDAAGIVPILVAIPPRSDTTLARENVLRWNYYIRLLSEARGWPLLDAYNPYLDASTGNLIASESGDGIHPTRAGHAAIGIKAAADLAPYFPPSSVYYSRSNVDAVNLVSNPANITDAGPDGIADGWGKISEVGTPTYSLVAGTGGDGVVGNWQRVETGTASSVLLRQTISTGFSVGDKIRLTGRVRISTANTNSFNFEVTDQASTRIIDAMYLWQSSADITIMREAVIPSGSTSIRLTFTFPAATADTHYMEFSGLTLVNLTTGDFIDI